MMHSHPVMNKGETRVWAPVQSREELVRCELPANKRDEMCAQGNNIMMHTHRLLWTKESVCTLQRREELVQCESPAKKRDKMCAQGNNIM